MSDMEGFATAGLILAMAFAYGWVLFNAFRTGFVWGLLSFLLPVIAAVFAFSHWGRCHKPVLLWLAAVGTMITWCLADPGFWVR